VGIATDHLHEAILTRYKRLIVDAAGVHLAKAGLTALSDKALRPRQMLVPIAFVGESQSIRGTIDYYRSLGQRLLGRVSRLQAQLFEVGAFFCINGQSSPTAHQVGNFSSVSQSGTVLVKRNLVDFQRSLGMQEQSQQRLANGSGAYHMNRAFRHHTCFPLHK
jgi:hypothetical protein